MGALFSNRPLLTKKELTNIDFDVRIIAHLWSNERRLPRGVFTTENSV
jgi:hypothetical protein